LETLIEWAIDITVLLAVVAIALFVRSRAGDRQQRGLRETAARLGLQFEALHMGRVEGAAATVDEQALLRSNTGRTVLNLMARTPMARSWRVWGRRDGLNLSIEPDAHGHGTPMTRLRADFERPLGVGLELSSRAALDRAPASSLSPCQGSGRRAAHRRRHPACLDAAGKGRGRFSQVDQARSAFEALSQGGQVTMPLAPSFWAETFGMLTDRFGVSWAIPPSHRH
jgi:hypothetical protein